MSAAGYILKDDVTELPANSGIVTAWATDVQGWRAMRTMNITKVSLASKSWTVTVEEDPETGDAILQLPPELIKIQGWKEGDTLEWNEEGNGAWSLSKRK
jgi:hypothetical protein